MMNSASSTARAVCAFVLFLAALPVVSAQGIGVSPVDMAFDVSQYGTEQKQLIIYNPNDKPMKFSVSADELQDSFRFSPQEESIPPQASRAVTVAVSPKMNPGGYFTRIYVSSIPSAGGMVLSPAAAVSTALTVREGAPSSLITTFAVAGNEDDGKESQPGFVQGIAITVATVVIGLAVYTISRREKPF